MIPASRTALTAAARGAIRILEWKPYEKNTLKGFLSVELASGLVLHSLMLHEKNGSRWIGFPAREWVHEGIKQFARFIEFRDRAAADRFRDQVLDALDVHLTRTGETL
jgi:hypothetical protein